VHLDQTPQVLVKAWRLVPKCLYALGIRNLRYDKTRKHAFLATLRAALQPAFGRLETLQGFNLIATQAPTKCIHSVWVSLAVESQQELSLHPEPGWFNIA